MHLRVIPILFLAGCTIGPVTFRSPITTDNELKALNRMNEARKKAEEVTCINGINEYVTAPIITDYKTCKAIGQIMQDYYRYLKRRTDL